MNAPICAITVFWLLPLSGALAQAPDEEAAYRTVSTARDSARRFGTGAAVSTFEREARSFLRAHPKSPRRADVRLWLGDLLKEKRPRDAYGEYLAAGTSAARARAADLAFRNESPPEIAFESWIGVPLRPGDVTGAVTMLVFFSVTHPQARNVLSYVEGLRERYAARGLRVAGIAAVVDDHKSQTPAALEERLQQRRLPFPVAVDKQRRGGRSVTLRRYRGEFVPWVIFIDRYGRIAWLGAVGLEANAMARMDGMLQGLLKQPTYDALARRVREGDEESLDRLAAIRTVHAAATLAAVVRDGAPPRLAKKAREALRTLLPKGVEPEEWDRQAAPLRYSFAHDRLVRATGR